MKETGICRLLGRSLTGRRDSVFLNVVSRTIGRTLVSGPFGLPGFCISMSTPLPRPSGSWCSSASLNMLAIVCPRKSADHLNSSAGMASCPLARPLFSLPMVHFISSGVIR